MNFVRRWFQQVPATTVFVGVLICVWLISAVQTFSLSSTVRGSSLAEAMVLYGPLVSQGGTQWLRALGASFVHADVVHMVINAAFAALLGREIERATGSAKFAGVVVAGALGSSASVLLMDYQAPTVGASGVVFALMVLFLALSHQRGDDLRAPLVLIGVNVVWSLIGAQVSLWGHVGGLITGVLLAIVLFSFPPRVQWPGLVTLIVALAFVAIMI